MPKKKEVKKKLLKKNGECARREDIFYKRQAAAEAAGEDVGECTPIEGLRIDEMVVVGQRIYCLSSNELYHFIYYYEDEWGNKSINIPPNPKELEKYFTYNCGWFFPQAGARMPAFPGDEVIKELNKRIEKDLEPVKEEKPKPESAPKKKSTKKKV